MNAEAKEIILRCCEVKSASRCLGPLLKLLREEEDNKHELVAVFPEYYYFVVI